MKSCLYRFDRRLLIEQKSVARDAAFGSEVITWTTLAQVWGSALDVLNTKKSGGEHIVEDMRVYMQPCRVVIHYRADITTDMRVTLTDRSRVMQIVSVAEIGRRKFLELMCEAFTV